MDATFSHRDNSTIKTSYLGVKTYPMHRLVVCSKGPMTDTSLGSALHSFSRLGEIIYERIYL